MTHTRTPLQSILELIYNGDTCGGYEIHLRDSTNSSTLYYRHGGNILDYSVSKIPGVFSVNGLTQSEINTHATPIEPSQGLQLLTRYITLDWIVYKFQLLGEPRVPRPNIIKRQSIIHHVQGPTSRVVNSFTPSFGTSFEVPNDEIKRLLTTYHLGIVLGQL